MDQLEARKQVMRGQQRVFTGDSRPAMMSRASRRSSFVEPAEASPISASSPGPVSNRQPLLQFDSNGDLRALQQSASRGRIANSKSVFGVDQLWEKEMAKLKIIQEKDEAGRIEHEAEEAKAKKKKDKGKGKAIDPSIEFPQDEEQDLSATSSSFPSISPIKRASYLPPTLRIDLVSTGPPGLPVLTEGVPRKAAPSRLGLNDWFESDDESEREEGVRPARRLNKGKGRAVQETQSAGSEDDVPLSRLPPAKVAPVMREDSSGDEEGDLPLSTLAKHSMTKSTLPSDNDDDDTPLLLRMSKMPHLPHAENEDDLPLAYRHSHFAHRQSLETEHQRIAGEWWQREMQQQAAMAGYIPHGMPLPFPLPPMWGGAPQWAHPVMPMMGYPPMMAYPPMINPGVGAIDYPSPPVVAEKAIDSWRKEVPVAPTGPGPGSKTVSSAT